MSQNLCECVQFLRFLASVRNSDLRRKILLEKSDNEQLLRALKEIAVNVVHRNLPLDKSQKVKLQRQGKALKKLASIDPKSKRRKQKLIKQTGGFLPILIPSLISVLSSIASQKLSS